MVSDRTSSAPFGRTPQNCATVCQVTLLVQRLQKFSRILRGHLPNMSIMSDALTEGGHLRAHRSRPIRLRGALPFPFLSAPVEKRKTERTCPIGPSRWTCRPRKSDARLETRNRSDPFEVSRPNQKWIFPQSRSLL